MTQVVLVFIQQKSTTGEGGMIMRTIKIFIKVRGQGLWIIKRCMEKILA